MSDLSDRIKKAELAKARATDRLARLRTRAAAEARRADAHRKIELGGLIIAAGVDTWDPATIVGALLDAAALRPDSAERLEGFRQTGLAHLEARAAARVQG
jgi:hypothetical protein